MKKIVWLIVFSLLLIACKTKHVQIERKEDKTQENKQAQKDSVFEQKTERKLSVFELDNSQSVELELETEKDSTGQSKVLEFERIRSPSSEKIIVRGGKVKLKSVGKTYMSSAQKDTLQMNRASVRTNINQSKVTENKEFKKQKKVKTQGFTFGGYLSLILWGLVLVVLAFIAWRLKLFRKMTAIITKFKRLLKNI